jgi:biotin carboxyl carrier protein
VAAVKYYVEADGRTHVVEIRSRADGAGTEVIVDGAPHPAELAVVEGTGLYSLLLDDKSFAFAARFEEGCAVLAFHDREVRVPIEDERTREARRMTAGAKKPTGRGEVRSRMPGVVKEVRVAAGEAVKGGQPLLVLEAMKMENEIRADRSGVVRAVHVRPGQAVEKGALLALVEDADSQGTPAGETAS